MGHGDPNNYFIGTFPVAGSSGLDLHWHGGIKLGDNTGDVLNISTGNVGIGTSAQSYRLQVAGDIFSSGWHRAAGQAGYYFESYGGGFNMMDDTWIRTYGDKSFYHNTGVMRTDGTFQVGPNGDRFSVGTNGNVGIGTNIPSQKLHVEGSGIISGNLALGNPQTNSNINFEAQNGFHRIAFNELRFWDWQHGEMVTMNNGKIGIGTTTPDQMLTVNGTIHSKEVIVDNAITPDYVFQKYYTGKSNLKADYVMPTLAEIETFTKANNHLPNVPSAKEMQEKGMSLGEMNNLLLQKVEELTLYAIEQQKRLDQQQSKSEQQQNKLEEQTKDFKELKDLVNNLINKKGF